MTQDEREIRFRNIGDPRRRDRFKSTFSQGSDSPFVLYAIAAYEKAFKMLEKTLSDGRDWIFGDQYTLADINLMPYVARLVYLELAEVWIGDRPHVQAWWERVQELPSFKVGVSDLLTVAELAAMAKHGPVIRDRLYQVRASHLVQMP